MKDIDFDELDRAVSSVLEPTESATPTPDATTTDATAPAAEPGTTSLNVEAPVESETPAVEPVATTQPATEPAPAEPTPIRGSAPLAVKRRGQFMDVVHPSSDMTSKSDDAAPVPARKVTIQPLSPSVTPDAEQATIPASDPVVSPSIEAAMVEPESQEAPAETTDAAPVEEHAMPDPLDVMQQQEEAQAAGNAPVADSEAVPVDATETETSATPFLADTKVEKRPLDAFSAEDAPAEEPEAPAEESEAPAAEPTPEPVPPELQADVVAVESNPSDKVEETPEKDEPVEETKPSEDTESGFATSIPQQYTAAEAKTDGDHSIFDTKEYHQPLAPVAKKKRGLPGWLIALVVFIILAGLSAAGGYFWFYYGL